MSSYTKNYNLGYHSTDDRLKGNDTYPQPSGGQNLGTLEVLPDIDRYINIRNCIMNMSSFQVMITC